MYTITSPLYVSQGLIQLLVLEEGEIRHAPVLYYYMYTIENSREGKSTSGVGNPCAPHPLHKSLSAHTMYTLFMVCNTKPCQS